MKLASMMIKSPCLSIVLDIYDSSKKHAKQQQHSNNFYDHFLCHTKPSKPPLCCDERGSPVSIASESKVT
jgi:hypothetical protein